jgi:hypothetical protein
MQFDIKRPDWVDCIIVILIAVVLALGFLSISGCMTVDKAKTFLKDKGKLAEICAETYPTKDSTVFIKGDTITSIEYYHDTTYMPETDTIYTASEMVVKYRPCPPTKVITKRITDTVIMYMENTARVEALRWDLAALQTNYDIIVSERNIARKQAKNRLWWLLLLIGAGGVYLFLKLKKIVK